MNPILRPYFTPSVWEEGVADAKAHRVKNIQCTYTSAASVFTADVSGAPRLPYEVEARLVIQKNYSSLDTQCSCKSKKACVHAAALLYILESEHRLLPHGESLPEPKERPVPFYADLPWYAALSPTRKNNWFDFEMGVEVDGQKINILPALLEWVQTRKDLGGQEDVILPITHVGHIQISRERLNTILNTLSELLGITSLNHHHRLTMTAARAALLMEMQQALAIAEQRWLGFHEFAQLGQALQHAQIVDVPLPQGFTGKLRDYQKAGFNWLQFLRQYQLGGVLADDMGLGKTIQTLVHLLAEKEAGRLKKPCLIICPTSLLHNWHQEIQHFTPALHAALFYGIDKTQFLRQFDSVDVWLTSYKFVLQNKEVLLNQSFDYLVLDEAQFIKNPRAKTTLVIQQLQANHRLCLTGTPMENHLGDLWSIFHFLMPGFLGTFRQFNEAFRIPIEKKNDANRRTLLAKRTSMFLLRRTKELVAKELPEKITMIQTIELSTEQRDLYETIRFAMEDRVRQAILDSGIESSQMIILDALLKLRQVCCDPRVMRITQGASIAEPAKLLWLLEALPSLLSEGRRILLFSTFKSVLMNIAKALDHEQIPYVMLTGDTRDRKAVIDAFQEQKVPLFLISLKAGGFGLNLTAADTVIHYDPWWNPAVEAQATDRAHRIGQTKTVFVYKLIAKNTVEEKMLQLQEKKGALLSGIMAATQASAALKPEEILSLFQPL